MQKWTTVLSDSFTSIGVGIVNFIPRFLVAILVVVIGWIIGALLAKIVAQIIRILKLDEALRAAGIAEIVGRTGLVLNTGKFLGALVKWFTIAVFLVAAFNILGLVQVNTFLQEVVIGYLPQVVAAVIILLLSGVIGEAVRKAVVRAAKAAEVTSAGFVGSVAKWAIWIFGVLAALIQLGIAASIIQILFTGVVVALALAFGLSFGLGGQQAAATYIEKVKHEISGR